jgi:tRNA1(Val) A37 N6-methylase TrmN6
VNATWEDEGALDPAISDDAFLDGSLRILQPREGHRAGLESLLLAAAAGAAGVRALDVGSGVGVAGLALLRTFPKSEAVLVERDAALVALARRNIARNGFAERARVLEADVVRRLSETPELSALVATFDCVLANPPFFEHGSATAALNPDRAGARAMPAGDLAHWARFMGAMARPGATATIIAPASALANWIAAFTGRFGGLTVLPIHPRADDPALRVILQGVKASRAPLCLLPGLVLHDRSGRFRPDVEALLRRGGRLPMRRT